MTTPSGHLSKKDRALRIAGVAAITPLVAIAIASAEYAILFFHWS